MAVQHETEGEHGVVYGELAADVGPLAGPKWLVGVRVAIFRLPRAESVAIESLGIGPHQRVSVQQRKKHDYPVVVNAPHLVALVQAGGTVEDGKLVERASDHDQEVEA